MRTHKAVPAGTRFGRLVTLEPSSGTAKPVLCQCDCTREKLVPRLVHLLEGRTTSCGCYRREFRATHGLTTQTGGPPSEYIAWASMRARCRRHPAYVKRGIAVCKRWDSFENFYADMGPRPSPHHSLDRINNDGNYEPENCRWATSVQQMRNTSWNRRIEIDGVTRPLSEWCERLQVHYTAVDSRLRAGWKSDDALLTPFRKRKRPQPLYAATEQRHERIVRAFKDGRSIEHIAKEHRVGRESVRHVLKRYGVLPGAAP